MISQLIDEFEIRDEYRIQMWGTPRHKLGRHDADLSLDVFQFQEVVHLFAVIMHLSAHGSLFVIIDSDSSHPSILVLFFKWSSNFS